MQDKTPAQWHYLVIETEKNRYGLALFAKSNAVWSYADAIEDISVNYNTAKYAAELFTEHQLSPHHFHEAVYDLLCV